MPPTYRDVILAGQPSHYWRLDEAGGPTAVDTTGGAHGAITGGVTLNQPGALLDGNPAMLFNGTTGHVVATVVPLGPVFTIEAWIKTTSVAFMEIAEINNIQFYVNGGSLGANVGGVAANTFYPVADGKWHHVVLVSTGAVMAQYADGAFKASGAAVASMPGTLFYISRYWGSGLNFFNGAIDEVAIYPRVLPLSEIAAHYAAGFYTNLEVVLRNKSGHALLAYDEATTTLSRLAQGGLVATPPAVLAPRSYAELVQSHGASNYWRLDEATGLLARDRVGGKDGTISGGVTLNQAGALADGDAAMTFDAATGKILTPSLSVPVTCTVEFWFKTTFNAGQRPCVTLRTDAQFLVAIDNGALLGWTGGGITTGLRLSNDGRWHHGVVVFGATQCAVYVDGTLDVAAADTHVVLTGALRIGHDDVTGFSFNGSLDEVAVYPVALTPAQIAQHYAAGFGQFSVVEPVCWNKSGDPVLGYLEPTDALVVLAGGGVAPAPTVLAPTTYAEVIRRDAPNHYWRLDEATGLLARDSVGAGHGTISGGVTLNQPGALADGNPAMRFDGTTGKIVTAANVTLPLVCTVEFWLRTSVVLGDLASVSARSSGSTGDQIFFGFSSAGSTLFVFIASPASGVRTVTPGPWHHAAIVFAGGFTTFYLDGAMDGTPVAQTRTAPYVGRFGIGWDEPNSSFFPGLFDEVAVYPVALTPAQIAQHYAAGYGVFPTVEPVLRSKSGHAVLGYNESTDQLSVLCQGTL